MAQHHDRDVVAQRALGGSQRVQESVQEALRVGEGRSCQQFENALLIDADSVDLGVLDAVAAEDDGITGLEADLTGRERGIVDGAEQRRVRGLSRQRRPLG